MGKRLYTKYEKKLQEVAELDNKKIPHPQLVDPRYVTKEEFMSSMETFINQPHLHLLTEAKRKILFFMLTNLVYPGAETNEAEFLRKAGVCYNTYHKAILDPVFNKIYTMYVKEIAKLRHGEVVNNLFELSKKNVRAAEVYLKYADLITERIQTKNININADVINNSNMTPQQNLAMLVEVYRTAGYTLERLLQEIADIWNQQ